MLGVVLRRSHPKAPYPGLVAPAAGTHPGRAHGADRPPTQQLDRAGQRQLWRTGQWARVLRSEFTDHWDAAGVEPLPGLLQTAVGADLYAAAMRMGDDQMQALYAGASYGRMTDLPGAADVVRDVVQDATQLLGRL